MEISSIRTMTPTCGVASVANSGPPRSDPPFQWIEKSSKGNWAGSRMRTRARHPFVHSGMHSRPQSSNDTPGSQNIHTTHAHTIHLSSRTSTLARMFDSSLALASARSHLSCTNRDLWLGVWIYDLTMARIRVLSPSIPPRSTPKSPGLWGRTVTHLYRCRGPSSPPCEFGFPSALEINVYCEGPHHHPRPDTERSAHLYHR